MTSNATPATALKLGTTLYSFTTEFITRRYSFEQLIAKVAQLNLGPGLEMVGFQSIRGFPAGTDAFAERFRELMAFHGLQPSCLAINADMALRRGQMLTINEAVAYHEPQLRAAARLGFPTVRCQFAAPPEVLRRLVPLAEKLEIKMGPEIHAPMSVNSPPVLAYREMYAKVNSPSLGFIPDFGSSAREVPPSYLAYLNKQGMPADLIKLAVEIWHSPQDARQKREEFTERATQRSADSTVISALAVIFNILSRQEATAWLDIMPQVIHIHGKCYDFALDGTETSIPYDELLPIFVQGGYNGFMSTEWEGHLYSQADGFDMVQKHHALCRRIVKMSAIAATA
jgi:sugar phosphate isomerase/epimerase